MVLKRLKLEISSYLPGFNLLAHSKIHIIHAKSSQNSAVKLPTNTEYLGLICINPAIADYSNALAPSMNY